MIEIIDGIAYLKGISNHCQSLDMHNYLKEHPNQKLYLIMGQNKYGCGENGELVSFANMSPNFIENGFCINQFYVSADYAPSNEPKWNYVGQIQDLSRKEDISLIGHTEAVEQCDSCKAKLYEVEMALENAINEKNTIEQELDLFKSKSDSLAEIIAANEEKLEIAIGERDREAQRANLAEEKLIIMENQETKIDKTDIRGLCKALYDLGFNVDIEFIGYGLDMSNDFDH